MARRRSYFAKSNRGNPAGVFLNNVIADANKRKRDREKDELAKRKRLAKEVERETVRLAKEAEREKVRREREAERRKIELEKLDAKAEAVAERLKLEFEKIGLFAGLQTISDFAKSAALAEISPAKAKSYFLDGKEEEIGISCAVEFLENEGIRSEFHNLETFEELVDIVSEHRPQWEVEEDKRYQRLKNRIDIEISDILSKETRQSERQTLIQGLLESKVMFKDELEEFAELIEENDWGSDDALKSKHYLERIERKEAYRDEIHSRITSIKL